MNRQKLLEILTVVRPALASNDLVPVLTYLWFTGDRVLACNDAVAVSAPCPVGFSGAVPGATLLALLQASRAKEIEFNAVENEVSVRAAGARMKLPLMSSDSFLFEMPKRGAGGELPVGSAEFVGGVKSCLRSVSQDTSVPDQLGVTLIPKKKGIGLYSTNGISLSRVRVSEVAQKPLERRVVLSGLFCEQLVRLAAGDKKARLTIAEDHALLSTSAGVWLYGKLVEVDKPLDFDGKLAEIVPKDLEDTAVKVPAAVKMALERALVIADPTGERARTRVDVKDEVALLLTKSGRGEIHDRVKLPGHPDISVSVDPQWLKVGCAEFDKLLVTEQAVIFSRSRELYMVATTAS